MENINKINIEITEVKKSNKSVKYLVKYNKREFCFTLDIQRKEWYCDHTTEPYDGWSRPGLPEINSRHYGESLLETAILDSFALRKYKVEKYDFDEDEKLLKEGDIFNSNYDNKYYQLGIGLGYWLGLEDEKHDVNFIYPQKDIFHYVYIRYCEGCKRKNRLVRREKCINSKKSDRNHYGLFCDKCINIECEDCQDEKSGKAQKFKEKIIKEMDSEIIKYEKKRQSFLKNFKSGDKVILLDHSISDDSYLKKVVIKEIYDGEYGLEISLRNNEYITAPLRLNHSARTGFTAIINGEEKFFDFEYIKKSLTNDKKEW